MFVKTFLLTLSYKFLSDLSLQDVCDRLSSPSLFGSQHIKVMAVSELHDNGNVHYHLLIIANSKGLSKNTYHNDFRRAFPEIAGMGLDVRGVKNPANVVKYLLKSADDPDKLLLINLTLTDLVDMIGFSNNLLYLRMKKWTGTFDE